MKYFCITFLLCCCLCINTNAQIANSAITTYSKFLSKRNARLIASDTLSTHLEPIYASFIKALIQYRSGPRNRISIKLLKRSYRCAQKCIYKILDSESRKKYKRLIKSTGNILLVEPSYS